MRAHAIAAAGLLLAGCTPTLFYEPRLLVSPYATTYRLRGDTRMQSDPNGGGPPVWNRSQSMPTFGHDRSRDDFGVRVDLGDGFAGIRFDYFKFDNDTTRSGVLDGDWGALENGERVTMRARMDEYRISYLEPLLAGEWEFRELPLQLQLAGGGAFVHRSADLIGRSLDSNRTQRASLRGDVLYGSLRGRASWREFMLDLDLALSPDLALGGDYGKLQYDAEIRLGYAIPRRDLTIFAGYRHSSLQASGSAGRFGYEADLQLEGFQVGLTLSF